MEAVKETAACLSFFILMFMLLVFGTAISPYEPSPFNEEVANGQ